ncbi:hypothetical protein GGR06_000419 [Bacteroides reticulotermitis]|uniref:Uncharacterized protein n=1 Tax=Bacteroides reticulotermitis TaxID=1133319 RepID=A0A840CRY1_9BACE|nr:hypothetical protein [Bacteroides reticulotermitis]
MIPDNSGQSENSVGMILLFDLIPLFFYISEYLGGG